MSGGTYSSEFAACRQCHRHGRVQHLNTLLVNCTGLQELKGALAYGVKKGQRIPRKVRI